VALNRAAILTHILFNDDVFELTALSVVGFGHRVKLSKVMKCQLSNVRSVIATERLLVVGVAQWL